MEDIEHIKPLETIDLDSQIASMAIDKDNRFAIVGTRNGFIKKINLASGKVELNMQTGLNSIWSIVMGNNEDFFIATASGVIRQLRTSDFDEIKSLISHQDEVNCLAISSDYNYLYSCGDDKTVRKWHLANESAHSEVLYEHPDLVYGLSISYDNKMLASGCKANQLIVYSLDENKILKFLTDCTNKIWCTKFTPDSKYLIAGSEGSEIFLWTCNDWNLYTILNRHTERVRCLEVSSDSKILFSGSLDKDIIIWNIKDKKPLGILKGHADWIKSIIRSEDSAFLYSTGDDQKIIKWDINKFANQESSIPLIYPVLLVGIAVAIGGFLYMRKR